MIDLPHPRQSQIFASMEHAGFRWFWVGLMAYSLATHMEFFAKGYLAYHLTGLAKGPGIVWLAYGVPVATVSLVAGAVADRVGKREMLVLTQIGLAAEVLIAAILVQFHLVHLWQLIVLSAVHGVLWAFTLPPRLAIASELVQEGEVPNALAWTSAAQNMTRLAGPAIFGLALTLPVLGIPGAFYTMLVLYGVSAVTLTRLPRVGRSEPAEQSAGLWSEVVGGFAYVAHNRTLVMLFVGGFLPIVLGSTYIVLLPVIAEDAFGVGGGGLGLMGAAVGAGSVLATAFVAHQSGRGRHLRILQVVLGAVLGGGLIFFAICPWFPVALALLMVFGFGYTGSSVLNNAVILVATDHEYRGRVMSLYAIGWSTVPLIALPMTAVADVVGVRIVEAAIGATALVFVGVGVLMATVESRLAREAVRA